MVTATRKLGRKPLRLHQLRATPSIGLFLKASQLPPLPPAVNWLTKMAQPAGMMLNDQCGDCTCAAHGHLIQSATANTGDEFTPPDADILGLYEAVTAMEGQAYNPALTQPDGSNPTDGGCNLLDVINYVIANGLSGHKVLGVLAVNPKNSLESQYALYLMGNIIDGVSLTANALQAAGGTPTAPGVWDIPAHPGLFHRGQYMPDPNKGHAIFGGGYDAHGNVLYVSWGEVYSATPSWQAGCVDERYVVIPADWERNQVAANGIDSAALNAYFSAISGVS